MNSSEVAQFINFCLFSMGIATLMRTTVGNRLPIVQGPSATLAGTLAPVAAALGPAAMWSGVLAGAIVDMLIGLSGLLRHLRKLFPPVVAGVVVMSIGFSLGKVAVSLSLGDGSATNLFFAGGVVALIFVLQVGGSRFLGGILTRGAIFFSIFFVGLGVAGLLGHGSPPSRLISA